MSSRPELRLDWCSHKAAEYACKNWHYSRCMPAGSTVKIGVWEGKRFIGVVIFSRGATPEIGSPYGLKQTEICELTRVALCQHKTSVSRILSVAIRLLISISPNLRLVVSFADTSQGHHGGIYQANGWLFAGTTDTHAYFVNGRTWHPKSLHGKYGKGGQSIPWLRNNVASQAARVVAGKKHRYLMPLDSEIRKQIEPLRKPYPKRVKQAMEGDQPNSGGAAPTHTLQQKAG